MTGQRSPIPPRFPWEKLYIATVLEADNARLPERVKEAEETLSVRSLKLKDSAENEAELRAIEDALRTLAVLKRERLTASRTKYVAASCVYCNSPACQATGNALRGIIVRYECGPTHLHYVRCPYCAREFEVELNAKKVWFVQRDARLAI
jgi:hypothetical protein